MATPIFLKKNNGDYFSEVDVASGSSKVCVQRTEEIRVYISQTSQSLSTYGRVYTLALKLECTFMARQAGVSYPAAITTYSVAFTIVLGFRTLKDGVMGAETTVTRTFTLKNTSASLNTVYTFSRSVGNSGTEKAYIKSVSIASQQGVLLADASEQSLTDLTMPWAGPGDTAGNYCLVHSTVQKP